jgi:hypothetical protein
MKTGMQMPAMRKGRAQPHRLRLAPHLSPLMARYMMVTANGCWQEIASGMLLSQRADSSKIWCWWRKERRFLMGTRF